MKIIKRSFKPKNLLKSALKYFKVLWKHLTKSFLKYIIMPFAYLSLLGVSFYLIVENTNNKIIVSLIIIIVSLIYLVLVIYENKSKNLIDKVINFTFLTISASPLLVYAIVLIMNVIKPALEVIGTQSSWIGFFGSLIGGSLVMFALVFTMHHDKIMHANISIPILKIELDDKLTTQPIVDKSFPNGDGGYRASPQVFIKLTNESDFVAFKVRIRSVMIQNYHEFYELEHRTRHNSSQIKSISSLLDNVPVVFAKSSASFSPIVDEIVYDGGVIVINTDIDYTDAFDIHQYTVTSRIEFFVSVDKDTVIISNPQDLAFGSRFTTFEIGEIESRISKITSTQI